MSLGCIKITYKCAMKFEIIESVIWIYAYYNTQMYLHACCLIWHAVYICLILTNNLYNMVAGYNHYSP